MELAAVDVRQVMAAHATLGVGQQGFGDQLRPQEGAADTDVHHVGDGLFAVTAPQAVMDTAHQFGDLVEDLVYFRHHIDAIDTELVAHRAAQGGVQDRTTFGGVDDLAAEHRLDGIGQPDWLARFTSRSRVCSVIRFSSSRGTGRSC